MRAQAILAHALADLLRMNRQQARWIDVAWRRLGSTWDPDGETPEERAHTGGSCDPKACAICRDA